MSKRSWKPFAVGDRVGGGIILEKLNDERLQTELQYFVRWPCCDRTATQTHSQLAKRARTDRVLCWHCARKLRSLTEALSDCSSPKDEEVPRSAIEIPLPGISGMWSHFGKLGSRWGSRGADFKAVRGAG